MRRTNTSLLLPALFFASAMQAQAPAPSPELKKQRVLVDHWTEEGEYKPGHLRPSGKVTGIYDARMTLGGFVLQPQQTEKGAMGEAHFLAIDGFDPVSKSLTFCVYTSDGSTYSGKFIVNGTTITWTGRFLIGGKEYLFKEPFVLAPDKVSATAKAASSTGEVLTPSRAASIPAARSLAGDSRVTCQKRGCRGSADGLNWRSGTLAASRSK